MQESILDAYNSPEGAEKYTRKFRKHWTERINNLREQRLLAGILRAIPHEDLTGPCLDMPCGYGRLYPIVREAAANIVEGDWSFYLLREARRRLHTDGQFPLGFARATALAMPYADRTFSLVLSARLCHHIGEPEERLDYLREILRISRGSVVFTYFDQQSFKNRTHELSRRRTGKRPKWTLSRRQVRETAREAGFSIVREIPLSTLFSGHVYSVLRRDA